MNTPHQRMADGVNVGFQSWLCRMARGTSATTTTDPPSFALPDPAALTLFLSESPACVHVQTERADVEGQDSVVAISPYLDPEGPIDAPYDVGGESTVQCRPHTLITGQGGTVVLLR